MSSNQDPIMPHQQLNGIAMLQIFSIGMLLGTNINIGRLMRQIKMNGGAVKEVVVVVKEAAEVVEKVVEKVGEKA